MLVAYLSTQYFIHTYTVCVYACILLRVKEKRSHILKVQVEMEFQEDQGLGGLVDQRDLQDQLEKKVQQEVQEGEDQKALRVIKVFQVELVHMVNLEEKDNLVNEAFQDLQVLLGHLDHQDVCVTI